MKSRIKKTLGIGALVSLFLVTPAFAVENAGGATSGNSSGPGTSSNGTAPSTTTTQTETSTTTTTKTTDKNKEELAARMQKRKDALKIKLTTVQEKRIQTRCKNSQGIVSGLQGKVNGIETSRTQVYGNLVDRLTKLQAKLDQKGADTIELKTEITELQAKITIFNTDFTAYKQSMSDLASMDCVTDPTGFKASLEDARNGLKKVQADSAAIKTYVNEKIKLTLAKIRAGITEETKPAAGTTGNN